MLQPGITVILVGHLGNAISIIILFCTAIIYKQQLILHFNLRLQFYLYIFGILLSSISSISFVISSFYELTQDDWPWQLSRSLMALSTYCIRFSLLFCCIERFIATKYANIYEKEKNFFFTGIILLFFAVLFSLFLPYIQMYGNAPVPLMHCILTLILIANISFSRVLITLNKRLRRVTVVTATTLSHRYQIVRNLDNLRSIEPHAVLNSIFSGAALLLSIIAHSLNAHGVIKVLSYFLTFNTYTVISLTLYIITARSKTSKNKVSTYSGDATNSSSRPPILVKTTLGNVVRAEDDINSHFASLKQMWA